MGEVIGVKISPISRDYIAGMLYGDVIFISICFVIIYIIKNQDADLKFMLTLFLYNSFCFSYYVFV